MRKNTVKEIWARGGAVLNGWCSIPRQNFPVVLAATWCATCLIKSRSPRKPGRGAHEAGLNCRPSQRLSPTIAKREWWHN